MKWINAEQQVTVTIYDEEHEEHLDRTMSVEEMLDTYTNDGCPTIYSNPEQIQWIPVSERLPEIHQDVLLSLRSLDVLDGFRAETEPYFYCQGDYIEPQNVVAWMPIPQPYKESEG